MLSLPLYVRSFSSSVTLPLNVVYLCRETNLGVFPIYISSTERTIPPSYAHVQLDDVSRTLYPAKCRGRVPSAQRRGDGDGEVIRAGLRLNTTKI